MTLGGWYLRHESRILPWLALFALLAVWQGAVAAQLIDPFFFSSPLAVVNTGWEEVRNPEFWADVQLSGFEFLVGYFSAIVVAVPFGILAGWFHRVGAMVEPWINGLNSTPRLALLPLIVVWVGVGPPATTLAVFVGVFFTVVINIFYGIRSVRSAYLNVASSFGATESKKLTSVVIPGTTPFVLAGARLGIGRAVIGVVIGEFYSSTNGLGNYIFASGSALRTDKVLFGAVVVTGLAMIAFTTLGKIEARFHSWRPKTMKAEAI